MTREEHLLTIAVEECAEVAHRLTKSLRFGLEQVQAQAGHAVTGAPDESLTNRERVLHEFYQLRAVLGMCGIDAWDTSEQSRKIEFEKVRKVEHFLSYSADVGTLTPSLHELLIDLEGATRGGDSACAEACERWVSRLKRLPTPVQGHCGDCGGTEFEVLERCSTCGCTEIVERLKGTDGKSHP